jgi:perosamine synthetase
MSEIPVSKPDLTELELRYGSEAIQSSWISSTGPYVTRFESQFAELCHTRAAISVANGTVALHLAMLALGISAGDEVIVPSLTYVATANAVRYVGATPIFVDVDPRTWCLDPGLVESRITKRTRAIVAVHLYGHPADMDALSAIAKRHNLFLIEDAAEAHFARYKGRVVGSLSDVGMFSFYGNKIITCGEGGALVLNDPDLERRARLLRGQGMDPERRYYFPVIGYNFRLTNLACAILCAQLERREEIVARRRDVFRAYAEQLRGIDGIELRDDAKWAESAPWLMCVVVNPAYGISRDVLAEHLKRDGIDTRPFFVPIHSLPPYAEGSAVDLPVTDRLAEGGLNLPTFSSLSEREIGQICGAIRRHRR